MTDEPERLYRPVDASFFPSPNIVASLDRSNNIVFFNAKVFEQLSPDQRRKVYKLDTSYLELATTES